MPLKVGITTTLPVEVIYAAGHIPVDLNNRFITHPDKAAVLAQAEREGFPAGVCAWIKGLYTSAKTVDQVVIVTQGDCANTAALGEVLAHRGVKVLSFSFPTRRERLLIQREIDRFAKVLGAGDDNISQWKNRLDKIRAKLVTLDELTWKTGQVTGAENHLYLVNASDFGGDPDRFEKDLDAFLEIAKKRAPDNADHPIRLGVIGVPTILDNLYEVLEKRGVKVVFNEIQRQFSMPNPGRDLAGQYENYTYPFDLDFRMKDITAEVKRRKLDGLIHYIQSFCHRQIEDIVIREKAGVPVLAIEGDNPGPVDGRTKTRLDAFLEMLREH